MTDKLKEIRDSLQGAIKKMEENGDEMNRASWWMQEGALISGNDAKVLVRFIDAITDQKDLDSEVMEILNKKFWDLI